MKLEDTTHENLRRQMADNNKNSKNYYDDNDNANDKKKTGKYCKQACIQTQIVK